MSFSQIVLDGGTLSPTDQERILNDDSLDPMALCLDAFQLREKYFGRKVKVHILNNVQSGLCAEDCGYCGQAKTSDSNIQNWPVKAQDTILAEAHKAKQEGAHRYCMVLSGRGPVDSTIDKMCETIKAVKEETGLKTCLSVGLLSAEQATRLKEAGLDRVNHNLNTSANHYPEICSTHTHRDRLDTLGHCRNEGLELCSGFIFGMGESLEDRLSMARDAAGLGPESIPVNFLLPIEGNRVNQPVDLTPETCLRILCLFRYLNPKAEIRMAAGREYHLRSLQAMALYPANSLFAEGYLLTQGQQSDNTLRMILDAGFEIETDEPIDLEKIQDDAYATFKASSQPVMLRTTHE